MFISADDALAQPDRRPDASPKVCEARDFLTRQLADGPRASKELLSVAKREMGIGRGTLFEAKRLLNVVASKTGFDGGWEWRLPPAGQVAGVDSKSLDPSSK